MAGRQYHIGLAPGDIAEYILICGDPARAERTAQLFDTVTVERRNREYVTYTGTHDGVPVSIMATGIGADNTEIALVEMFAITQNPTILRVGTTGALQPQMHLEDLVISTGAVRLENTSAFFVQEGYPAVANYEVVLALIMAAEQQSVTYHVGLTATAPGFYAAQGRTVPGLPLRYPHLRDQLTECGVLNFEMETSTLLTLCGLKGVRAGTVCTAFAARTRGEFISTERKIPAEMQCVEVGLAAIHNLARMDAVKQAQGKTYWFPTEL
ncbi:MAG: nucleoside phosphorylase [Anaerolineae bacterium]|nr:nucleoside phosphorylase [Anaerolineae bacterium]